MLQIYKSSSKQIRQKKKTEHRKMKDYNLQKNKQKIQAYINPY